MGKHYFETRIDLLKFSRAHSHSVKPGVSVKHVARSPMCLTAIHDFQAAKIAYTALKQSTCVRIH